MQGFGIIISAPKLIDYFIDLKKKRANTPVLLADTQ